MLTQDIEGLRMAVMMDDCRKMMETGRCQTCGSVVIFSADGQGDIDISCQTCKTLFSFSPGFFY